MNQPPGKAPAFIDCFKAEFPAGDPQSAASYARLVAPAFDFEIPSFARAEPFAARSEIFCLPELTVSRASSTASRFARTTKAIAARGTDQMLVVCYTSGHFTMTVGDRTTRVEAGQPAFIDLSQEIVIEAPAVENISLAISRRRLETMVPFLDDAHGFVREPGALSRLLCGMMQEIVALGPTMPVVDARAIAGATIQLAASCLEPLSRQQVETSSGRSTVSLVTIKEFIERRLSEPTLRPQTLLDEFGITRSTLYRLFESRGGVSAYITQRKLHHAFRLMTDTLQPRRRISQLASDLGFSHPSAFTRAFKELFGMSPKDVQTLAAQSKDGEIELMISPELMKYLEPIVSTSRQASAAQ